MDSRDKAQALIDQFAGEIDLEGLAFDEGGAIDLQLDENQILTLAVAATDEALFVNAIIGGPVDALPAELLRRLLHANGRWHERQGPFFAVDPGSRQVVLQQSLPLAGLEYGRFRSALEEIVEAQAAWIPYLEQVGLEGAGQGAATGAAAGFPELRA